MRGERILQFHFDAIAREGAVPAGGITQSNHKIVGVLERALHLFAGGQGHYSSGDDLLPFWIEHARFEFDGAVLVRNAGEIAARRMTILAAARSLEKGLAGVG